MKIRDREALIENLDRGKRVKYVFFWGHDRSENQITKSCLSQWYHSPFEADGFGYMTAEHRMMYLKAKLFGDQSAMERALAAKTPGEAKSIGREVTGFDQEIWESRRCDIVVSTNMEKFSGNPELASFLVNTGSRVLVEASPIDKIWGIGLAADDPKCEHPEKWRGTNLLGFALMEVRDQLSA